MANPIRRIGVVGAGTMGHGIAQVCAASGYEVTLTDVTQEFVDAGLERIRGNLDGAVSRGKLDADELPRILARIDVGIGPAAAGDGADLIIEAVPEKLGLKAETLAAAADAAPEHAILASNTSSLSIDSLHAAIGRPHQLVGLHFFNPVFIMKLVEVIRGSDTSQSTVDAARGFVDRLGKVSILVSDSPGFATSRLGITLGNEAMRMLEEGVASAEDIDKAMELGYRHPMGPLKLSDLVGLDVRLAITRYLYEELGTDTFKPPEILIRLVSEGKTGRKAGEGFYRY
jgi:3-hydroxybutyryl-CoA dehydrogenase